MLRPQLVFGLSKRFLSTKLPAAPNLNLDELHGSLQADQARTWLEGFRSARLQRSDVEISFARSSGPGGQVHMILEIFL